MTDAPNETYDPILLTLTGSIVTWWGRIEGMLFHDLLSLQHDPAVKASGACDPLPIATKRLIKAWTKATQIFETEEKWQHELAAVKLELEECSQDRHVIVHGFWDYPDPVKCDRTQITVMKPGTEDKLLFAQYNIDIDKLSEMERRFIHLYHRILPFTLNHGFRMARTIFPKAPSAETEASQDVVIR